MDSMSRSPLFGCVVIWVTAMVGPVLAQAPGDRQPASVDGSQKAKSDATKPSADADPKLKPSDYALPGENPPAAFVPKNPRTVEERKAVESVRLYAAARSLEDRRQFREAIKVLEQALSSEPDSVAILRRLSRLTGALGQVDRSIEFSRKVIASDPNDTETLVRLVEYYRGRRRDPAKAEALLKEVLANPNLNKNQASAIIAQFELAKFYTGSQRFAEAAEALIKVVDGLDDKSALKLTPADQRRILGLDEAEAYQDFGMIFLAGKKREWAIKAFQRGLVYSPDHPQISALLAQTYLDGGDAVKALTLVEALIKRKPQGREIYDLLTRCLVALKREKEVLTRLEALAKENPRNIPLQYALVDQYRAEGRTKEADSLTNRLIDVQPDLQGFAGLFAALLKEKKTEEILRLLERVAGRIGRVEAVDSQLKQLLADQDYSTKVLDSGLAMLGSKPAKLSEAGYRVLRRMATLGNRADKTIELLRWSLKNEPDPLAFRELAIFLAQSGQNEEGAKIIDEMIAKYPNEQNPQSLVLLAQLRLRSGKEAEAIKALREALKIDPRDLLATRLLAISLNSQGKTEEAITLLRDTIKSSPSDVELNGTLGGILAGAGRDAEAIAFWKALIEKYPNNDELNRIARSSLSVIYTNQGDFAKGEAELEILFAKNPDEPGVNNDLGYLYADQGKNLEKAEEMIRKAVAEDSENSSYLDSLGWVLFKRGKTKEALTYLEKAVQLLTTDDATIHDHIGQVYFELRDREKAKAAWEKAEKIASAAKPPDKRLADIRKRLQSLSTLKPKSEETVKDKP